MDVLPQTPAQACGIGKWKFCGTPPKCYGAVGSGTSFAYDHIASGQRAVEIQSHGATMPSFSGFLATML